MRGIRGTPYSFLVHFDVWVLYVVSGAGIVLEVASLLATTQKRGDCYDKKRISQGVPPITERLRFGYAIPILSLVAVLIMTSGITN